jgi:23S rRNA-/tRNA-specific pseudouridylate synthase
MGMPILSDDLYGDPSSDKIAPRMMLHAVSLTFPHPVTNQEIVIRSPLPADFKR